MKFREEIHGDVRLFTVWRERDLSSRLWVFIADLEEKHDGVVVSLRSELLVGKDSYGMV